MAVSEMKKLCCITAKEDADRLIASMQRLACVEITCRCGDSGGELDAPDTAAELAALNLSSAEVQRAIEFLSLYDKRKYSLFDAPQETAIEDFDSGLDAVALAEAKAANELRDRISSLESAVSDARSAAEALLPWEGINVSLPEHRTAHTVTVCGTFAPNISLDAVRERLREYACVLETVSESAKGYSSAAVICHRDDLDSVRAVLAQVGFSKCTVFADAAGGYASGELERQRKKCEEACAALEAAKAEAERLADKLPDIKALYDIFLTRRRRLEAKSKTETTASTAVISGWVPAKAEGRVTRLLKEHGAAYEFEEPADGDDVPVALSNNAFAENFEPIVSMYALPLYRRYDPTPVVSLFYAVIFGLMFADVGYGLILFSACMLGLRLLHPKEGMKRLLKMFAICSVSCIIAGILFGGYFGDLPNALMKGFGGKTDTGDLAVWFNMVDDPMVFLVVSLAVGVVHMVCGMVIKLITLCRDGHVFAGIFDVGSWLVLFAGIGIAAVNTSAGLITAAAGALMLVATQGRNEKNIFMKAAKGVMSLYDIVSYASDLLSYSRILALGLASAVIANVVNLLATMGGATVPGVIMFILIFLVGHIINFLVNILGTYVHTSRLQYIEFFGKFYESGGREFAPLMPEGKYTNLK